MSKPTNNPKTAAVKRWRDNHPERSKAYMDSYRKKHPEVYKIAGKRSRIKLLKALWEMKEFPCTDCGIQFPPCIMQFDHVRGIKVRAVSSMTNLADMIEEAKKCELVCANCHGIRTWTRLQKK